MVIVEMTVPRYWMHETSSVLRPVVEAYLGGERLTDEQVPVMRAYLRQWIAGDWAGGPNLTSLRLCVDLIASHDDVATWVRLAHRESVDPF